MRVHETKEKGIGFFLVARSLPLLGTKTLDNYSTIGKTELVQKMLDNAKEYLRDFEEIKYREDNWIAFLGSQGVGSHLSLAVANKLLDSGVPVLYFPAC